MRKKTPLLIALILGMVLSGCGNLPEDMDQIFESDTVINIPLNPRQETEPDAAQPPADTATQPPETETAPPKSDGSQTSGSKTSSGGKSAEAKASAAQPPETAPPETDPPDTEPPEPTAYDMSGYVPGALEYAVAEQINVYRAEAGLEPLSMDIRLSGIASVRAYEVLDCWSHTRPDGSEWQSVLSDNGCASSTAAEALAHATGFDSAAIVDKWMNSKSNKADLLNPDFTAIGVGSYTDNGMVFLAAILIG